MNKNYVNAEQVLPPQLLEQVRQYAEGRLLYVPSTGKTASLWGEGTGQRSYYRKRNQMLRNKYAYEVSVSQLADEYCLSQETVKKIVYNKRAKENLPFFPHAISARQYSQEGLLEEWIHTYLLYERRNKEFSDGLYLVPRQYMGPLAMPLSLLTRSSGPEEHMKWRVHPIVWEEKVAERQQLIRQRQLLPPLIVNYSEEGFELNCGSPLYEALVREEIPYFPVIVWCSSEAEMQAFVKKHQESMAISI